MKLETVLGLLVLLLVGQGCASSGKPAGGGEAIVEFVEPEKFSDFESASGGGNRYSAEELKRFEAILEELGERHLPAGYQVRLKITDVNRAGFIPPTAIRRVRVITEAQPATADFTYVLTDAAGQAVKQGEERLVLAYPQYLRDGFRESELEDLRELFRGWFQRLGRSVAPAASK